MFQYETNLLCFQFLLEIYQVHHQRAELMSYITYKNTSLASIHLTIASHEYRDKWMVQKITGSLKVNPYQAINMNSNTYVEQSRYFNEKIDDIRILFPLEW